MPSAYETALTMFRSIDLKRRDAVWPVVAAIISAGSGSSEQTDLFDPCPIVMPDQFVPGPVFGALGSDTDCDGTSYYVYRIFAANLADAKEQAKKYDDVYDVVPYHAIDFPADNPDWSERDYFNESGYCTLGASWNPWVEDDTLGTILDHSMEV